MHKLNETTSGTESKGIVFTNRKRDKKRFIEKSGDFSHSLRFPGVALLERSSFFYIFFGKWVLELNTSTEFEVKNIINTVRHIVSLHKPWMKIFFSFISIFVCLHTLYEQAHDFTPHSHGCKMLVYFVETITNEERGTSCWSGLFCQRIQLQSKELVAVAVGH